MIVLQQMIILFLLIIVGFICSRIGILDDVGSKRVSSIVVHVANPALILSAGINPESTLRGTDLLKTFGLSLAVFAILIIIAQILPRILRVPVSERSAYQVMMVFSNIGFMGFPLISAVYGSDALLSASLFLIPYNVLIYTYGINLIKAGGREARKEAAFRGEGGRIPERDFEAAADGHVMEQELDSAEEKQSVTDLLKKVFNIGVIACILTLILYMTRCPVPYIIEETVDHLSGLTAPLSMMVIGASISKINVKKLLQDWKLVVYILIKLLLIPAAGVLILKNAGISYALLGAYAVILAAPVGSMTVMLAQEYDGNDELASKGVALSTLLSVVTIPLVSLLV